MAKKEDKKSSEKSGYDVLWELIIIFFIIFAILSNLGKFLYPESNSTLELGQAETNVSEDNSIVKNKESDGGFFSSFLDFSKKRGFLLGDQIATKSKIDVYNNPNGQYIGTQEYNSFGRLIEGPRIVSGMEWWRVDFENTPDGWIKTDKIGRDLFWAKTVRIFTDLFDWLRPYAILLSILLVFLIVVVLFKRKEVEDLKRKREEFKKEQKKIKEGNGAIALNDLPISNLPISDEKIETENITDKRWDHVQVLINSHNVNDWRQAIIESDIILGEMLEKMGYKGVTIADKLKAVEPSDFFTLNQAWEAHKVRNVIAHKGSEYILSRDEAERVIGLYKQVFEEFYIV